MRRMAMWVAGVGVAALLVAIPKAGADETKRGSTSSGAASGGSGGGSEARGSGQAGTSTGARPGEVTGAPSAPGGTSEKEQQAAAGSGEELSGTVEKYDRQNRTLSLSGSDKELKITDDTQVTKGGDRVSPGQIMEGDEVRASLSGSGEELGTIEIMPGASSGGAAPSGSTGVGAGSGATGGSPKDTASGASSGSSTGSTGTK